MLLALVLPVFVDSGGGGFYPVAIDGVKLTYIHHVRGVFSDDL